VASAKRCPKCGEQLIHPERRPAISVEFVTAVRDSSLSREQLQELTEAARSASPDTTPRELAERVPEASQVIVVAARAGERWLQFLVAALTILGLYLASAIGDQAHRDAQEAIDQAHEDAERALREARQQGRDAASLSDEEITQIAEQIEAELDGDSTARND
jgi:hypothetical protein